MEAAAGLAVDSHPGWYVATHPWVLQSGVWGSRQLGQWRWRKRRMRPQRAATLSCRGVHCPAGGPDPHCWAPHLHVAAVAVAAALMEQQRGYRMREGVGGPAHPLRHAQRPQGLARHGCFLPLLLVQIPPASQVATLLALETLGSLHAGRHQTSGLVGWSRHRGCCHCCCWWCCGAAGLWEGVQAGLVVASRHPPRSQARVRARCRQCHGKAVGPRFRECHCQGAAAAAGCDGRAVA
mmetsp:Transcript_3135/g.8301  ORF Transcript_3135/g.8301 Transcript_3135/m.8301 type:complete len:237 (-) Transcript_3135:188-898(-)|eukprot:366933-Pelagomonas_calceolata.AAC.4